MIVNGVDAEVLRRAAAQIRAAAEPVRVSPRDAADWLEAVAVAIEYSRLGEFIPGLQSAGRVAATIPLAEVASGGRD